MTREIGFQRARLVSFDIDSAPDQMIVGQLQRVIKIIVSSADVQNVDEPGVCARDRLERGHAFEFSQKGAFAFKCAAVYHLDRAKRPGHRPRQPNLTVSAAANHTQHFVIGNNRYLSENSVGNPRFYTSRGREAITGT